VGHPLNPRIRTALLVLLPLMAAAVVVRQARPFAIVSDDHSYYGIATSAARAARNGMEGGVGAAIGAFSRACSVKGDLPPHISRKRPLLLWVWSAAYLAGGDRGLVWVWRAFYLLLIGALFLVMRQRSSTVVASAAACAVAVAPAMQGLLSWMSCSTYLVSYPLLLLGAWALRAGPGAVPTAAGLTALVLAMLSREVAFLLVPTAVAADVWCAGRRRLACSLPILAAVTWIALPAEDRSILGAMLSDPWLVLRASLTVILGHAASLTRNVGLLLMGMLTIMVSPRRRVALAFVLAMLLVPGLALLAPIALLVVSSRSRNSIPGIVWAAVAVLSLCLYGTFTSRYAVEPLLGCALAIAPTLRPRRGHAIALGALLAWQLLVCLAPDTIYRWVPLRAVATMLDKRFEPLAAVTAIREREWVTFAGRTREPWDIMRDWSVLSQEGIPEDRVSSSSKYLRLGHSLDLHCPHVDDLIASRDALWEWNVWYWRVPPPQKAGVHVYGPDPWSVHAGIPRNHTRCRRVVPIPAPTPSMERRGAISQWLADAPELMNPPRVHAWLGEVWDNEEGCPDDRWQSSFREQELGRLLVRDDGWLDAGELAYLREHVRRGRAG